MKNNKKLLIVLGLIFPLSALADPVQEQINSRFDDQRMQQNNDPYFQQQPVAAENTTRTANDKTTISLSKEEFVQQPGLVGQAMLSALIQHNEKNVVFLFPIYQQIPPEYQDPLVIQWANAVIAKQQKNYRDAIKGYRAILAENNDILPVRLQLAIALFENNETEAAEDQFQKLRSESLPQELQQFINSYLEAIANQNPWSFSGGLTYLNDHNINNAPKAGTRIGNWTPPERESAQGYAFSFEMEKKWAWGNGFFNEFRVNGSAKYYWDNKKYNEYTGRAGIGLGFKNARQTTTLLPFMEQTWYAGGSSRSDTAKRFSQAGGATLEWQYWLSPQWQLNIAYEYAEQRYRQRKHLNGNYHFISSNLFYFTGAKQYWFIGGNYNRTATREQDDSFIRRAVQIGWGQEWNWGLSTRLSFNYAHKHYRGPMPIFNLVQRNKEYGINASIWHRAVHYAGITPRLTWNYHKVKSNHAFYTYDKHRVFLEFSKRF